MDENPFLTYQKFDDKEQSIELAGLLKEHQIKFLFEDTSASFDPAFASNEVNMEYRIKLRKEDFEKADKIQMEDSSGQLDDVREDHYLFEFTDQELMEVIIKQDEWSKLDFLLAQKILKDRGREVTKFKLDSLKKQRIQELSKPEEGQKKIIRKGYLSAILGGPFGIFTGWFLNTHKKTLPNGDRVFAYSPEDRKHGNNMMIIGIISFAFWITLMITIFIKMN